MAVIFQRWFPVALSFIAVGVQSATIFFLIKRKSRLDFPLFLAYNALTVAVSLVMIGLYVWNRLSAAQYFYAYAGATTLLMILEFGVMYEVVTVALKPYGAIIDLGKMLFKWAGVLLIVAAGLTAFATAGSSFDRCTAGTNLFEKSLRLMQCGLLLLFFLFERRLSLSWRSRPVGVAIGLGVSASVGLVCAYMRAHYIQWTWVIYCVENVIYLGVAVFWMTNFASRNKQSENVLDSPSRLIFQRWNEALSGYGYGSAPSTVESFLPGIEKTVDRVMARRVS